MDKKQLEDEIRYNVEQVQARADIIKLLSSRLTSQAGLRNSSVSYPEYDNYWRTFWERRDILRTDLTFTKFDQEINPPVSPLQARQMGLIPLLVDLIKKHHVRRVLEIGSGAGINLLLLAPVCPDVEFFGLEPTAGGVEMSREFISTPPPEFALAHSQKGGVKNIRIVHGSILDTETINNLRGHGFDFVFTSAVLEQLHNSIHQAFSNIFQLGSGYFYFNEEWLEANYDIANYTVLVESDYFRISWNYLHRFQDIETLERSIPPIQPGWLRYGSVLCKKKFSSP